MSKTIKPTEKIVPTWAKETPIVCTKNDLREVRLGLTDEPPKPSAKEGIYELTVNGLSKDPMDSKTYGTYTIMVTKRDLGKITQLARSGNDFTFDMSQPWANVVEWRG